MKKMAKHGYLEWVSRIDQPSAKSSKDCKIKL